MDGTIYDRLPACWPESEWLAELARLAEARLAAHAHGDLPRWRAALAALPGVKPGAALDRDAPLLGGMAPDPTALRETLMALHPWRKGPLVLGGVFIDTEWRSDWKWRRVAPHLDLAGQRVLDIGCGNGYFGLRMLGAGAALHGGDYTKAACRAVQDAIYHSSLTFIRSLGLDSTKMKVAVTIGVQKPEAVDVTAVKAMLPHGDVTVNVRRGGLERIEGAGRFDLVVLQDVLEHALELPDRLGLGGVEAPLAQLQGLLDGGRAAVAGAAGEAVAPAVRPGVITCRPRGTSTGSTTFLTVNAPAGDWYNSTIPVAC